MPGNDKRFKGRLPWKRAAEYDQKTCLRVRLVDVVRTRDAARNSIEHVFEGRMRFENRAGVSSVRWQLSFKSFGKVLCG